MPKKILIDTDPGIDDTMAILFALRSPELEVVGMTAVFGNAYVDITAQNALRLVELEDNHQVPVAKGASLPLVHSPRSMGMHVHGDDGMGGANLAPPKGEIINIPAAPFIVQQVLAHPGEITLVPVGPLTNIALALRLEPRIADLVKEVVIMGGSAYAGGNASPVAEANIYNDAHAAEIVFSAGWPLTMVGLDATLKCIMSKDYLGELGSAGNPATDLIRRVIPFYQKYHHQIYGMNGDLHTHDPSAVAYVIDPSIYQTECVPMFVETTGRCAGQTVPDIHQQIGDFQEINVCLDVDSVQFLELYKERIMK